MRINFEKLELLSKKQQILEIEVFLQEQKNKLEKQLAILNKNEK